MDKNNYCVIMAGGIGSRFWPLSRKDKPKQFIDILGTGKSLLQQTYERFCSICLKENIFIVTNIKYKEIIFEQIPGINSENVLLEPLRRNTAPCIAFANYSILRKNKEANIIVAPSDHLILNEDEFRKVIFKALDYAKNNDALLTLGIKPNRVETGYGYIQINHHGKKSPGSSEILKVKTFTEKPDYDMAKIFFESGEFYWNSGIFIWSLQAITKAFETHLPDINDIFKSGFDENNTRFTETFIDQAYAECRNISIDYGIIEKAKNVFVLCADFGWSDLGTWGSLYENSVKDESSNSVTGTNIIAYDTRECIINIPDEKLAIIQGLKDYIVVESGGILLICKKKDEQKIRQFVNDVKIKRGENFI
ncbi:MAG: mannose-1-phosphate guanylyltransferase [Bacteroidales bacterium]